MNRNNEVMNQLGIKTPNVNIFKMRTKSEAHSTTNKGTSKLSMA